MSGRTRLVVVVEGARIRHDGSTPLAIGRSADNDVVLDRPGVSRHHLRISAASGGGAYVLRDLGSSNGTRLNGRAIVGEVPLRDGDRVEAGGAEVSVVLEGRRRSGRVLLLAVLAVSLVSAGAAVAASRLPAGSTAGGGGDEIFPLRQVAASDVFGRGSDVTVPAPAGARFSWRFVRGEGGRSRALLRFEARSSEGSRIGVRINGAPVGAFAPEGPGWSRQEVRLPVDLLSPERDNLIELTGLQTGGGPGAGTWEVRGLEVAVEPVPDCAPAACIAEAQRLFELGSQKVENRRVAPANLFEGWRALHNAVLHLEAAGHEPELYRRASKGERSAAVALDRRCRRLRFAVTRSVALGEADRARLAALAILRAFPGPEHPCHAAGQHLAALLAE